MPAHIRGCDAKYARSVDQGRAWSRKTSKANPPLRKRPSALNYSANATLHAYHPGRGQVNAQTSAAEGQEKGKNAVRFGLNGSGGRRVW